MAPADGAEERFGRKAARRMDRAGRLAAVAAAMALDDAGDLGLEPREIGTAIGSAHGGAETLHEAYETFYMRGADRLSPFAIPLSLPNTAASAVARENNLHGPSTSIGTACAAGSDAIGAAFRLIRDGFAEAMVAGGAEAAVTPFVIAGYRKLGALSPGDGDPTRVSRPFDRGRDGFVMGEGSGILVLEEREHARGAGRADPRRGGGLRAVVRRGASHRPRRDRRRAGPRGAARAGRRGRRAAQIGYVNAHATSTPAGDIAELRALAAAGLSHAPISSTKSLHGHALGAAGGIEAVAALMAFARGVLPAGANIDDPEPDPAADLILTPREVAHRRAAVQQLRLRRPQRRPRLQARLVRRTVTGGSREFARVTVTLCRFGARHRNDTGFVLSAPSSGRRRNGSRFVRECRFRARHQNEHSSASMSFSVPGTKTPRTCYGDGRLGWAAPGPGPDSLQGGADLEGHVVAIAAGHDLHADGQVLVGEADRDRQHRALARVVEDRASGRGRGSARRRARRTRWASSSSTGARRLAHRRAQQRVVPLEHRREPLPGVGADELEALEVDRAHRPARVHERQKLEDPCGLGTRRRTWPKIASR